MSNARRMCLETLRFSFSRKKGLLFLVLKCANTLGVQSLTVPSSEHDARSVPSGLNLTKRTGPYASKIENLNSRASVNISKPYVLYTETHGNFL